MRTLLLSATTVAMLLGFTPARAEDCDQLMRAMWATTTIFNEMPADHPQLEARQADMVAAIRAANIGECIKNRSEKTWTAEIAAPKTPQVATQGQAPPQK
jgi:hypothetical protein